MDWMQPVFCLRGSSDSSRHCVKVTLTKKSPWREHRRCVEYPNVFSWQGGQTIIAETAIEFKAQKKEKKVP